MFGRFGVMTMAMEFRLLGEVQLLVGGRPVELGHSRQRAVLAVLLIDANRVVPVDDLLARIWADRRPQRATAALYNYVSRLRHALTDIAGARIERRSGGYVIAVDPLDVDVNQFRTLIREALITRDDRKAAHLLDQGLQLWRGEPLSFLDTPWAGSVREHLAGERLAATLHLNDLELRLGRHAQIIDGLKSFAEANALDERLAAQLILALYRCGRQADALKHYEKVRIRLADELGTDPNPDLQELHHRILHSDPGLNSSPPLDALGHAPAFIPQQLPPAPRAFVGRLAEISRLNDILTDETDEQGAVAVLSGAAGIGKTALALHWTHRVRSRFPDGQLYINLRGFDPGETAMDPGDAIREFLEALGVSPTRLPATLDGQSALYRTELAGKRMLVLLDNARDTRQVEPLLPGTHGCLVLVTSRNALTGLVAMHAAHAVPLDLLSDGDASALLVARLGHDRVLAENGPAQQIIASCGRLPLALALAAGRASCRPRIQLRALAGELHDARHRLDTFTYADSKVGIRAVFAASTSALSSYAFSLFRVLGLHPGPDFDARAAAFLVDNPLAEVRLSLAELVDAHLVEMVDADRYSLHDLLRIFAGELAHASGTQHLRQAATVRMFEGYLQEAVVAHQLLDPHARVSAADHDESLDLDHLTTSEDAAAWFDTEYKVLLALIDLAGTTPGREKYAWRLSAELADFMIFRDRWPDWVAVQQTALASARSGGDLSAQIAAARDLGRAYAHLGHHDDALVNLRHALGLAHDAGEPAAQADVHRALAWTLGRKGDRRGALAHAKTALALYRSTGDEIREAGALNAIGWHLTHLGDHAGAISYCRQAVDLHRRLGNRDGEAAASDSLGVALHHRGDYARAAWCFERTLELVAELGSRYHEAEALTHLGDTRSAAGDGAAAEQAWRAALVILQDLRHPDTGSLLDRLGGAAEPDPVADVDI